MLSVALFRDVKMCKGFLRLNAAETEFLHSARPQSPTKRWKVGWCPVAETSQVKVPPAFWMCHAQGW